MLNNILDKELIIILFRIINFLIVSGLTIYLFRKYALKNLKENISRAFAYISELKKNNIDLEKECKQVDIDIASQEELIRDLSGKVKKWKSVYEANRIIEEKDLASKINLIEQKLKLNREQINLNILKKEVLRDTLGQAENKLKKEFESRELLGQYQENLINFMKMSVNK